MDNNIVMMPIKDVHPYEGNPRINDDAVDAVAASIREFGFRNPIIVDKDMVIIAGHTRYKAAKSMRMKEVPVIVADDLSDEQVRAYRLADNKTGELAEWDFDMLDSELAEIADIDMSQFGFDPSEMEDALEQKEWDEGKTRISLMDRFGVPPFSVFDTRQGYWQERKREWLALGMDAGSGRNDSLISEGLTRLGKLGGGSLTGTSIFDPTLCEIAYKWFCPEGGTVIDPFAGGPPRGIVAHKLGYVYHGCDLRQEQVDANKEVYERLADASMPAPTWYCGDSTGIRDIIPVKEADMLFTCPPYHDLEQYSDDPRDISNMDYDGFIKAYETILTEASSMIADNRFAVIVVGDIRDKKGFYRGFVDDTRRIMEAAGFHSYNDIILVNAVGTASVRASGYMKVRKVAKIHQNVLVFYKGDPAKIKDAFGDVYVAETEEDEDNDG